MILLLDQLSRHSQVVILSPLDKTVCLLLAVILADWKISVNYWKLPCYHKYFDCGIWLNIVLITKCSDNQGPDNWGTAMLLVYCRPLRALQKFINGSNNCKRSCWIVNVAFTFILPQILFDCGFTLFNSLFLTVGQYNNQ